MTDFSVNPGDTITDQFSVFEADGITKHSGLTQLADFTVTVWKDGLVSGTAVTITEIGTSGEYKLTYTPGTQGAWKVEVIIPYSGDVIVTTAAVGLGADISSIKSDTARILGLLHNNGILDNQTYDDAGQLLTARLRVFDAANHVPTTPGGSEVTGLQFTYNIVAEYDGVNKNIYYSVKEAS